MAKPLHLFIKPPYDNPPGLWTVVHGYGPENPQPAAGPVFHNYALFQTTGPGIVGAAVEGKLSVRPPLTGGLEPTEPLTLPEPGDPLPDTVTLYLHPSPIATRALGFQEQAEEIYSILGFAYRNIETASLKDNLAELLDHAVLPAGGLPREQIVELLLRGTLEIWVSGGHAIGAAATKGAPNGSRQVGFAVMTGAGPFDPSFAYDWMRDYVEPGQPDVDAFLGFSPKRWPVIDPTLSTLDAINWTALSLCAMPALSELKRSRNLTPAQWRQVGNNQKALCRKRLLRRVGKAPTGSTEPPFEFDDLDWQNLFQLEAVVEFYANFDDPWAAGATPVNPGDVGYVTVDFLNPEGAAATAAGKVVTLDGNPDLSRIRVKHDTIRLDGDTGRQGRLYKITAVDAANYQVTLDAAPTLAGPTAWEINLRPILVLIDAFGGRPGLQGKNAAVSAADSKTLTLDNLPKEARINKNFDTIYLPSDTARPSRTYRITAYSDANDTVTLDAAPTLDGGSSAWHIPAGVSGQLPTLDYKLGPGDAKGFDHYDGLLFIVTGNKVTDQFRWTSYTSRKHSNTSESSSSIRGNRRYRFSTFRSGKAGLNYCFKVEDPTGGDTCAEARHYFKTTVDADGNGKRYIRLHRGNSNSSWNGSEGCQVSPSFYKFRDRLILIYETEVEALNGVWDRQVYNAYGKNHDQSVALYNVAASSAEDAYLLDTDWNDKIVGTYWVIRPDERPEG